MKEIVRINENQLKQIVMESVNKVLYNEGLRDRMSGAVNGFRQGNSNMEQNDMDANNLSIWVSQAQNVLRMNNPQEAMAWLQRFVKQYADNQQWKKSTYGNTNTAPMF